MRFNLTPMVKNLLIINAGVFLMMFVTGQNLVRILGLRYVHAEEFQPYQIFTHMFMHADLMHLFFNMFILFILGPMLEYVWGPKRFLAFYLICGLGAAVLYGGVLYYEMYQLEQAMNIFFSNPSGETFRSFLHEFGGDRMVAMNDNFIEMLERNPDREDLISAAKREVLSTFYTAANIPMVGASGAIFGVLMGFGMLFPNTVLMLIIPPIPIKAKYLVIILGIMELFAGVQDRPGDNVAHFAHIGGMLIAFLLIRYWKMQKDKFY